MNKISHTSRFYFLILLVLTIICSSCNMSKKIVYFQDVVIMDSLAFTMESPEIRFRPDDQLTIAVSSRYPELSALFNIVTADAVGGTGHAGGASVYTIKSDGTIDFPVLGSLHIAGLTLEETSAFIKEKLLESKMISDPVVTVNYGNLQVYVLGEVSGGGGGGRGIKIEHKHMTLLEALSLAGDLTINGKRENVMVMRADSVGKLHAVTVDMRSLESIEKSPAYYLHQGDIVYVAPNRQRANQSTVNANSVNSVGFWTGMISFVISLSNTFLILFR